MLHPLLAFLTGDAPDAAGRPVAAVLAADDAWLETRHDYVQWLFPIPDPSRFNPLAPPLTDAEAALIRADPRATATLRRAAARLAAFYAATDAWLAPHDHNHLRITRIITCLRLLLGSAEAAAFHAAVAARDDAAGGVINPTSRRFWRAALGE